MTAGRKEEQLSFDLGGEPPRAATRNRTAGPARNRTDEATRNRAAGLAAARSDTPPRKRAECTADNRADTSPRDRPIVPARDRTETSADGVADTPRRDEADLPPPRRAGVAGASALVRSLARISARLPLDRKVIVCRTGGEGRELLRQLALRAGSWVGFEATTTRRLAITVAGPRLAARAIRITDAFDEEGLLDEAIDEVLLGGREDEHARLARGAGMRRALARSVTALRLAGVRAGRIRDTPLGDPAKTRILSGVLTAYERRLRRRGRADTASVYRAATRALRGGGGEAERAGALAGGRVYLAPGIERRGLAGRFLSALRRRGARVLAADPVLGLAVPDSLVWRGAPEAGRLSHLHHVEGMRAAVAATSTAAQGTPAVDSPDAGATLDIFVANSVEAELREVMRRARGRGLRWDEVEIVATDPAAYGSALHALAERMGIPVTFAAGLPVERTRPGRVAAAYFRWIEGGFDAGVVRTLLYASDLTAPRPNDWIRGASLARRLRSLRIGWGRDRYLPAIERALSDIDDLPARRYETPEKLDRRKRWRRRELEALRGLLAPALRRTPPVSMDAGPAPTVVSPSRVAAGLRRFLARTSPGTAVDDTALERMNQTLERIETALVRETDYRAAAAIVRRHLAFPVPAPRTEGSAPWSSAGGALHLAGIGNGGRTGRRATFIVGLDTHRFGGSPARDPYLLDRDRTRLAGSDLPLSTDRIHERRFQLAALLARLRGSVCLSHAAWDPAEARAVSPSPELLRAFRLMRGDATATFKDLESHVHERAGLVPRSATRLDATDVWMAALEKEGRLLEGEEVVRAAFPRIDAGLRARDALNGDQVTAHHGRISPHPELDPRRNPRRSVSASALGALGTCGKRYLYGYVLGVRPPDDPEYDPETWLDAPRRGSVLHRVYQRALTEARERALKYHDAEFESLVIAILGEEVRRQARDIPSPSDVVRARQEEELVRDAESFIAMIRDQPPSWIATELAFGFKGEEPVPFRSSSGPVMVRGAIDRLDRVEGGLRVVDYKTGRVYGFSPRTGVYHGGRRLQHVIYTAVASLGHDGMTAAMEYHFPTRKGENRSVPYSAEDLAGGAHLVSRLLDLVAHGHFLPTDSAEDCRFCDYKAVCRVRELRFGVVSPLADWVKERITDAPELRGLRLIRNWDEEGDGFLNALEANRRAADEPGGLRP